MPNLLAMSFEGELAPSFDLRCLKSGETLPDGWGLGYYPAGEPSASVLKEPAPSRASIRGELVKAWEHLESSIFVLHVRAATWGPNTDANTQPFVRAWGGRDWMIGHAGSLATVLDEPADPDFEPVGATDTERIFCALMARIARRGWRSLASVDIHLLHHWLLELSAHGSLDMVLCDGQHVLAYADRSGGSLYVTQLLPPYAGPALGDDDVLIDLTRRGGKPRKGLVVSSSPLDGGGAASEPAWRRLAPGEILIISQGAITGDLLPEEVAHAGVPTVVRPRPTRSERRAAAQRGASRLSISHRTTYRYSGPVERSTHLFRLVPMHDRLQTLLRSSVTVSVDGRSHEFDDVFGNRARRVDIDTPYTELVVEATSRVEALETDPLVFDDRHVRSVIPLVWMPWQRKMLEPYLQPPELPETELAELIDYAMRFARRNDGDVLDTLLDLNDAMHGEYKYAQGTTTLATTPFEVYATRRGVCQDFANLMICLARLLGVPARYVCGYVLPIVPSAAESALAPARGNQGAQASHAWVQVYLPEIGWRGLDPTNGIVTSTEHVRVAVGRNYLDATPTSGTIFVGGGAETLEVDVNVVREEPPGQ
jgi:transglutaminase-like putative cysteine protease/predicted glutamine amidotransferase